MRIDRHYVSIALALLLAPAIARGGGYEIAEQGAAATSMAGAFTAKADDASAIFYNAAGLAQLRGLHLYLGATLVNSQVTADDASKTFLPEGSAKTGVVAQVMPNFYAAYGFSPGITLGIGIFSHYGLSLSWPSDWGGRSLVRDVTLRTVNISPSIAWQVLPFLFIGGGIDVISGSADLTRTMALDATTEAELRFRGNDTAIGGNVGLLIVTPRKGAMPPIHLGFSYRTGPDLDFGGGRLSISSPIELSQVLRDVRAAATVPMPDRIAVALGVRPVDRLFLTAEFDWVHWSDFQSLTVTPTGGSLPPQTIPENWRDGYTVRGAGEVLVGPVALRLGAGFDWSPAAESTLNPIVPDSNRVFVGAGVGINLPRHLLIDIGLLGVDFLQRTSTLPQFPVEYSNWAVLTTVALGYRGKPGPATHP